MNRLRVAELYLLGALVLVYAAAGELGRYRRGDRARAHERTRAYRDLELENIRLATELDEARSRPRFIAGAGGSTVDLDEAPR